MRCFPERPHKGFCVLISLLTLIQLSALAQVKNDFCYPFTGAVVIESAWARDDESLSFSKHEL